MGPKRDRAPGRLAPKRKRPSGLRECSKKIYTIQLHFREVCGGAYGKILGKSPDLSWGRGHCAPPMEGVEAAGEAGAAPA